MNEEAVRKYRQQYREQNISKNYSGRGHLLLTTLVTVIVIYFSFNNLENVKPLEWLTIPLVFLLSNLVEYLGHKGPMHRKRRFLEVIFQRHAVEHHSFFTHEHMTFEGERDYAAVLFPPVMLLFFFGGIAAPIGILFYFLFGHNVAWLFVFTATLYFLNYELLHFIFHIDEDAWPSKIPFMKRLRKHHTLHHDRQLMNDYNFNITYPICDLIFGTNYREKKNPS
ncbi:hypothetical protein MNBD_ALPHA01-1428 [hydrothermal vent metagenome]|uniref:Fatty acid hydroxylase domain-containing protein n=1 Tax=hydrothermal vent metagenome TaxID=652676 RepID=A0A3B0SK27_9ZZZZ